jgi:hypothetical protein
MDVQSDRIMVARVVESPKPQPPQTMKPAVFLEGVKKQPQRPPRNCPPRP